MKVLGVHVQLLENKLEGLDLGLAFTVDKENFGAYEEIEVSNKIWGQPVVAVLL